MNYWLPQAIRRRFDPQSRYGLRLALFATALILVAVPFGLLLSQVTRQGALVAVDTAAANYLHHFVRRRAIAVSALKLLSFFGWPPWFWVLGGGVALNLWIRGGKRLAIFLLSTTIGGSVVNTFVKNLVQRPRPSLEAPVATAFGKSFPSGHTMSSTIMYGAILLIVLPLLRKKWRPWAIAGTALLVCGIGFSRLGLGVHYITDVLGGIALGTAWLTATVAAFEIWRVERGKPRTEVLEEGVEPEIAAELRPT